MTVTDPATWIAPWPAEVPLKRMDQPIYELACHVLSSAIIRTWGRGLRPGEGGTMPRADRVAGFVPVAPVGIETYLSELRRVQVPTLAVWGELDMVVPVAQADLLVSGLKGRKLIVAGASHACYLDRPDDFHAELLKFLSDPAVVNR